MNDLISRSELIAQLECFKLSLGDIILGFVVDRVIERVAEIPAAEVVKVETNFYDREDVYPNCTVQVLTNTKTGAVSVGWWENSRDGEEATS